MGKNACLILFIFYLLIIDVILAESFNDSEENTTTEFPLIANLELSFNGQEPFFTQTEYTSFFKIKNLDYPETKERIIFSLYYNLSRIFQNSTEILFEDTLNNSLISYTTADTSKIKFNESGNYIICGSIFFIDIIDENPENNAICQEFFVIDSNSISCNISLSIYTDKQIYENSEKIEFQHTLSNESFPFEIEYWVSDLFDTIVKERVITKNTNKKTYTPKIDEKEAVLIIKSAISTACNNTNNNILAEKIVIVKNSNFSLQNVSKIVIEKISKEELSFGDLFEVDVKIYKGDTRKTAIEAYLSDGEAKISGITSLNLENKFREYALSIPIQIKSNCNDKYNNGKYYLIVEGLDQKEMKELLVSGNIDSFCTKTATTKKSSTTTNSANTEQQKTGKLYELISNEYEEISGKFISLVKLNNPDEKSHMYTIWSYLYEGQKSYSGEREENKISLSLDAQNSNEIILKNKIDENAPQELNLKIKILREDRKTPYEITKRISINKTTQNIENITADTLYKTEAMPSELLETFELFESNQTKTNITEKEEKSLPQITGRAVYVSSNEKIKDYSIYLVIFLLFIIGLAILKLRN